MKIVKLSLLFLIYVLLHSNPALARNFTLPEFQPGDTVSSDFFNDIMQKIANTRKTVDSDDLVGTWNCVSYVHGLIGSSNVEDAWAGDGESLYYSLESTITFFDDGDGTYSLSTGAPDPFRSNNDSAVSSAYKIVNNLFFYDSRSYMLQRVNSSRINFIFTGTGSSQATLMCDKQNLSPLRPSRLAVSVSGGTVSLTWTDNSSNEDEFKIFRKDSVTGDYSVVGTANSDVSSYSETVNVGTYWYRVKASNGNGDSIGSNVIKVTIN